jgi:polar amino acid transport system substrate-binding protein
MIMHARRHRIPFLFVALGLVLFATACGGAPGAAPTKPPSTVYNRALHASLPADIRTSGVLRVATDASYAPASSFAADGRTIVGFEPDLAAALGRVLGVRVRLANADFPGLPSDVQHHRTDAVLSAMTDTPERERKVDFVNYFSAGTTIVVQRGNPTGITDLAGLCDKTVAVERGTIQVDLLARSQNNCAGHPITVKTYETNSDALLQLRTGRASAVLNDYPPAAHLATDPKTRSRYQLASTAQYEPGLYGIAVPKDRRQLRDAIHAALDQLMRSGEYAQTLKRWGVNDGALTESSINAGAATQPADAN